MRFIGVDSRVTRVIYGFPWQILIIRNRVGRIIKRWGELSIEPMEWQFYTLSGAVVSRNSARKLGRESDWKWPGVI